MSYVFHYIPNLYPNPWRVEKIIVWIYCRKYSELNIEKTKEMFIRNVGNSVLISMLRHLVKIVEPDGTLICGARQCDQILAFIISQEFWAKPSIIQLRGERLSNTMKNITC